MMDLDDFHQFSESRSALRPVLRLAMSAKADFKEGEIHPGGSFDLEDVTLAAMDAVRRLGELDSPPDFSGVAAALCCLSFRIGFGKGCQIDNGSDWIPTDAELLKATQGLAQFIYYHIERIDREENAHLYRRDDDSEDPGADSSGGVG